MLFYEQYKKLLTEATFRKSKQVKHLFDLPMFSVFAHKELNDELVNSLNTPEIKNIFKRARNTIAKMGFTSMHSNVMFRDLSKEINKNTGDIGIGGFAHHKGKYMTLDPKAFFKNTEYAHDIIIHEWAHLWMFNNSKGFNKAVRKFYNKIRDERSISYSYDREKIYRWYTPSLTEIGYTIDDDNNIWKVIGIILRNIIHDFYITKHHIAIPDPDELWDWTPPTLNFLEESLNRILNNIILKDLKVEVKEYTKFIKDASIEIAKRIYPIIDNATTRIVEDELYIIRSNKEWGENEVYENLDENLKNIYENSIIISDVEMYIYNIIVKVVLGSKVNRIDYNLSGEEFYKDRKAINNLVDWVDEYGMSNDDEIWATGIQYFFKLNPQHRKSIIKLMTTTGARTEPNRSQRRNKTK